MSSFRITTNGLYRNYRTNLTKNNQKLNNAMIGVETQRKFNSYAEDPAAASKAWRLRRSYWRTNDQIDNNNYIISKYESAYSAMAAIVDGDAGSGEYGLNGILSAIEGISDTSGSARATLGKELRQTAENIVSMMNTKYGDEFVFAGADGMELPFTWNGDKLLYRGVDVNTEKPLTAEDFDLTDEELAMEEPQQSDFQKDDGTGSLIDDTDAYGAAKAAYDKVQEKIASFDDYKADYQTRNGVSCEEGAENYAKLETMANETTYVDIGLGMKEDDGGKLIPGSAFNSAVSGLSFLGYGRDSNIAVIVRELGEIFLRSDPETGAYTGTGDGERADVLFGKLHDAVRYSQGQHTQLSTDAKYLKTNLQQLETNRSQLNEQIADTEDLEMGEAIMNMNWAQYCYNAALRIGTNILSQSLIDYMS